MDDDYVDQLSPLKDLQIILKTPFALLGQMKACSRARAGSGALAPAPRMRPHSRPPISDSRPVFGLSMSATQKLSD
jgi:hypothetical protein